MTLALILVGLLLLGYLWLCIDVITSKRQYRTVYMGSNLKLVEPHLRVIIKDFIPDASKVVAIEPGAGLGYVSRWLARNFTWKEVRSVEINASTFFLSKIANGFGGKVTVLKQNVLDSDFPPGSFVYSYLSTEVINKLYDLGKLEGCLVVSLTFSLRDVTPTKQIALPGWQKRLTVYDFRKPA